MILQTNRLILKTLDLNLIEAAAQRDIGAIEALGYKTSDEWPGPDFFEALPYFRELLIKIMALEVLTLGSLWRRIPKKLLEGLVFRRS